MLINMVFLLHMHDATLLLLLVAVLVAYQAADVSATLSFSENGITDGPQEQVIPLSSLVPNTRLTLQNGYCRLRVKENGSLLTKRWMPTVSRYVRNWQMSTTTTSDDPSSSWKEWMKGIIQTAITPPPIHNNDEAMATLSLSPQHHKQKTVDWPDPLHLSASSNITLQSWPTLTMDRDCRLSLRESNDGSILWRSIQDIAAFQSTATTVLLRQGDMMVGYDEYYYINDDEDCGSCSTNYSVKIPYTMELQARDCQLVQYVGVDFADFVVQGTRQYVWVASTHSSSMSSTTRRRRGDAMCELRFQSDAIVLWNGNEGEGSSSNGEVVWSLNVTEVCPACVGKQPNGDGGYGLRLVAKGGFVPYRYVKK